MTITIKYKIGNTYWFMEDNTPKKAVLQKIRVDVSKPPAAREWECSRTKINIQLLFPEMEYYTHSSDVYKTKKALLANL